jgi:NAD(P)-dependent dehydrogenase (short-subunit alcohol dehydrogenase family)
MPDKKRALITGANKSIGFETSRRLGQQNIHIIIGARDTARGEEAVRRLTALSIEATFVQLDVTDEESIARAALTIDNTFGRLDILINNAGISGEDLHKPSETNLTAMRTVYDTNVFGVVAVTNAMLPLLRKASAARIVNVSSGLGSITLDSDKDHFYYQVKNMPYQSSKAALNMITVEFAKELMDTPIKVNAADPGYTDTDFNNHTGHRSVEQAATIIVHLATLGEDGPTGTFQDEDGNIPW